MKNDQDEKNYRNGINLLRNELSYMIKEKAEKLKRSSGNPLTNAEDGDGDKQLGSSSSQLLHSM